MFAVLQEMDNILVMNKQQVIVMVYGYKVFFVTALNHKITFFKNYTAGGQNIKNINKKNHSKRRIYKLHIPRYIFQVYLLEDKSKTVMGFSYLFKIKNYINTYYINIFHLCPVHSIT